MREEHVAFVEICKIKLRDNYICRRYPEKKIKERYENTAAEKDGRNMYKLFKCKKKFKMKQNIRQMI